MFEAKNREYSLNSMPSALIVLSFIVVELGQRIYCEDYLKKFQLADSAYNKQSAIDVIIGTDTYFFLLRNGFQHLKESLVQCMFYWILTENTKSTEDVMSTALEHVINNYHDRSILLSVLQST